MILTILIVVITIIGIAIITKFEDSNDIVYGFGVLSGIGGGIVTLITVCCIICAHVGVDAEIEENRIKYEALCERQEIVDSEYEDVSKSDVIRDIAEWNKEVYGYKYWTSNPWTNWFHSKRLADSVEMIER